MALEDKLYAFVMNSHYHLITKIDRKGYGVVDLCTNRYTEHRFPTLEKCLKWAVKKWKVQEFNTYRELFQFFLDEEKTYDVMDLFKVKDVIDRETLIESEGYVDKVRDELLNKHKHGLVS